MEELVYCNTNVIKWYIGDMSFRKNGPCEIRNSGSVRFSQLNPHSYNRKNGACQIYADGCVFYYNSSSQRHRTDGPAVINADGSKEYWVNDICVTPEEFFLKYGVL